MSGQYAGGGSGGGADGGVIRPAVDQALAILSQVWPRYPFPSAVYERAVRSYPDDCIMSAAEEWSACQKWPPKPVELADEAKRFWRLRHADQVTGAVRDETTDPKVLARKQELAQQIERLDKRAAWLLTQVRDRSTDAVALREVEAMAGTAWQRCETDEQRQALRDGRIGAEDYIAAVKAYRAGSRSGAGAGSLAGSLAGSGDGARPIAGLADIRPEG
jgi:hypothetical protein